MGQSLVKNYVHIIFSTKHREAIIYPPHDVELYEYIAGICNKLECDAIQVGGYLDHVHILCALSKKLPMMTLLEKVKANSSKWFKGLDKELGHFYWQDGYAAFSVSSSQLTSVKAYIVNQEEHHSKNGYQSEFRELMKKHEIEFDERFAWD